ncbi:MAG: HK97 family phage prohead protease [Pseudomonadota bacterium]
MTKPDENREVRSGTPAEVRAEGEDEIRVQGYAAVFDAPTEIGDYFVELIAPGAFTESLARSDDVPFLINHRDLPLARTGSGTLRLVEDERGLRVETELDPSDPDVMRIVPKMKRGDLSKMSFAFRAVREEWDESGDMPRRTIHEAELFDVSIVTDPAYQATEIGLRSLEASRAVGSEKDAAAIAARMNRKARLAGV